ncbi:MAG: type II CRISPR RNA-guided endonuclease Cas9, partial [Planctomycetes bacterium]|nr:type II CRISPR RNA-guided endonuclease Cas9 [Planctomycetota bacterium]
MSGDRTVRILGLDVGVASVGWALVEGTGSGADPEPRRIVAAGVRLFSEGMDSDGKAPGVERRDARLRRRQTQRRTRRIARVLLLAQRAGLVAAGSGTCYRDERHSIMLDLDTSIAATLAACDAGLPPEERHRRAQLLPYRLRAEALDRDLTRGELARVFLNLAQRRGFKSNRRSDRRADPREATATKQAMADLERDIADAGARTLGEYFYRSDPMVSRIRTRRPRRVLYEREFAAIWERQQVAHRDVLTAEFHRRMKHALFHQRPLRSMRHSVGRCELEPRRRRALLALPVAQRFRLLQKLNDLRVSGRELTPSERALILRELERRKELPIDRVRKLLGLQPDEDVNLARGGETRIPGDETFAKMHKVLGETWSAMADDTRERLIRTLVAGDDDRELRSRLEAEFALVGDAALALVEKVGFDDRRAALSAQAIRRLLPHMERGVPFATARKIEYPVTSTGTPIDRIPVLSLETSRDVLRNPIVRRAIGQVRRVVTAVVAAHGKPDVVRIELVRDLKRSQKQRDEASRRNRLLERRRSEQQARLVAELANLRPDQAAGLTEKALLHFECGGICPYTGRSIEFRQLASHDVEIEHIIPFSRSLDDSFVNKTLCFADANRQKHDRTPVEAFGAGPAWGDILDRVRRFRGDLRAEKLRRFQLEGAALDEYLDTFSRRQLSDTAWVARLAVDQVALLYGGIADAENGLRVQTRSGGVTAHVRRELGMSKLLGAPEKTRDDHRHHAVDALAVAITGASMVQRLSRAAQRAPRHRRFAPVEAPWASFMTEAQAAVDSIVPSLVAFRKVRGAMHNDTWYGKARGPDGKSETAIRKPLSRLSAADVARDAILDDQARDAIRSALRARGAADPAVAFADPNAHPVHPRSGRPIHRVRVREQVGTVTVGSGAAERHVKAAANHHMPILG